LRLRYHTRVWITQGYSILLKESQATSWWWQHRIWSLYCTADVCKCFQQHW